MERFTVLTGIAAPLPETYLDTDVIFPARFLLLLDRNGLGQYLFNERRKNRSGPGERFVLDRPPYDEAVILVAGQAFGGGSSREHAVWALADFGIRCVISTSFGEIFHANCFKNGVLPIVVDAEAHARLMAEAEAARPLTVALEAQVVRLVDGTSFGFDIEPFRKRSLLLGMDEIEMILTEDIAAIERFEQAQRVARPWLYLSADQLAYFDDTGREVGEASEAVATGGIDP